MYIKGFGRFPISDRLIYGPYKAVQVWASQRFDRMDEYVNTMPQTYQNLTGWGIQSERFVNYALLPVITRERGIRVVEHTTMCFLRARSDESIWVNDCEKMASKDYVKRLQKTIMPMHKIKSSIEKVIGRSCGAKNKVTLWSRKPPTESLYCPLSGTSTKSSTTRIRRAP